MNINQITSEEARGAILYARAAALNAIIQGFVADNQACAALGEHPKWTEVDFAREHQHSGCDENSIIALMIHGSMTV